MLTDSGNSAINSPSSTNDNCSPRWIVYPNSRTDGASHNGEQTQRQCLDACVRDTGCATVELDRNTQISAQCWIHSNHITKRHRSPTVTQFEIVRRCYTTSASGNHVITCFVIFCYKLGMLSVWYLYVSSVCTASQSSPKSLRDA